MKSFFKQYDKIEVKSAQALEITSLRRSNKAYERALKTDISIVVWSKCRMYERGLWKSLYICASLFTNSRLLLGAASKEVVLLGGAHHKVAYDQVCPSVDRVCRLRLLYILVSLPQFPKRKEFNLCFQGVFSNM